MPMHCDGLTKLVEECGELIVEVAKKQAFPDDPHPDGRGPMNKRIELEAGDVIAAIMFLSDVHGLDMGAIQAQAEKKIAMFRKWHADPMS